MSPASPCDTLVNVKAFTSKRALAQIAFGDLGFCYTAMGTAGHQDAAVVAAQDRDTRARSILDPGGNARRAYRLGPA